LQGQLSPYLSYVANDAPVLRHDCNRNEVQKGINNTTLLNTPASLPQNKLKNGAHLISWVGIALLPKASAQKLNVVSNLTS